MNIGKDVMSGIKSLKRRVGTGEIMVLPTDKSGKLVVSSQADYIAAWNLMWPMI